MEQGVNQEADDASTEGCCARHAFSSAAGEYMKQLLTLLQGKGATVAQVAVDHFRKTPLWISATAAAAPRGFLIQRQDGQPTFSVGDHDFPIEQRMLISCSGVHYLTPASDDNDIVIDGDKPALRVASSGQMSVYLRPHRYVPCSTRTNMEDLYRTMAAQDPFFQSEVLLVSVFFLTVE